MRSPTAPLRLTVPDDAWRATGDADDPPARLLVAVTTNGTERHLEAWAVSEVGGDGRFRPPAIRGRAYALVATPYDD
jgi:hypothetical protein